MNKTHGMEETEILCFFTNTPCPRLQKKIRIASRKAKVTVLYWRRSNQKFDIGLPVGVLKIPVESSLGNDRGFFRLAAFLIFLARALPVARKAKNVRMIYLDFIDVLAVSYFFLFKRNMRVVYEVGDLIGLQNDTNKLSGTVLRWVEKKLLKKVDVLFLPSPFFWDEYYSKIYSGCYHLIENLPEKTRWENFHQKKRGEHCVVGFIGSVRYKRQLECLLSAVRRMRVEGRNISLFFAGAGPDAEYFKKLAMETDFLEFYGPYSYEKEIVDLYGMVDIIFSVYDAHIANVRIALPNRLYECIICGLPIIVAKNTRLHEYVEKLGVGYGVNHLSVDDCKKALESYMNEDEVARKISGSLGRVDKEEFFYEKYYKILEKVFC